MLEINHYKHEGNCSLCKPDAPKKPVVGVKSKDGVINSYVCAKHIMLVAQLHL